MLNERLRSAVSNSQILANKLAQERQANKDLDQQLLEQHQATERAQHNCMRLEHELQVGCWNTCESTLQAPTALVLDLV